MRTSPLIYSILLILLCACTEAERPSHLEEESEYQLLYSYGVQQDYYHKKHLITYFKSIALGSEYGNSFNILTKWKQPMKIHLTGQPTDLLEQEVFRIIEEINSLTSDGFKIEVVRHEADANFHIFFGKAEEYATAYSTPIYLVEKNFGLFRIRYDEDFNIYGGEMYVDTERPVTEIQLHSLREELTQSLGLANDIPYFPNSIFYESESRVIEFNRLDREVIRLLYHPKIISGLGENSVQNILEDILGL